MKDEKVHLHGKAADEMFPNQDFDYYMHDEAVCGCGFDLKITGGLKKVTCRRCLKIIAAAKRRTEKA